MNQIKNTYFQTLLPSTNKDLYRQNCNGIVKCGSLFLILSLTAACVTSKSPILGPETRVLPFNPPMIFEVYERTSDTDRWLRKQIVTLIADKQLVVRPDDDPSDLGITFYPEAQNKYLVQRNVGNQYIYGMLELRDGVGFLTWNDCGKIDQEKFRAGGGTIVGAECQLDSALNPLELLRSVTTSATGFQQRYVPALAPASISSPPSAPDPIRQSSCIINDTTPTSAPLQIRVGPNTTKDNPVAGVWLIPLTQVALDVVCREVGRVRSPGRTHDGQGALAFRIPEGIF